MAKKDRINPATLLTPTHVHRSVYTDPRIFTIEMERLFSRAWLYVAHESQLPNEGDYILSRMGITEVIVVRGSAGQIHVLHNACAHRGACLRTLKSGSEMSIICPYHAWVYRLDGSLRSVPHRESYGAGFSLDEAQNWLRRAARVDNYQGFIFASGSSDGPPLQEYLGPMTEVLDNFVQRAPEGALEWAGNSFSVAYNGNWKLHMENANDTVHPGFVHASSVAAAKAAAGGTKSRIDGGQAQQMLMANGFTRREWEEVKLYGCEQGHSYMGGFYASGILSPSSDDPVTHLYRGRLVQKRGAERTDQILGMDRFNNLIYPNLSVNAQYHQIRIAHPVAVDRTIVQASCFRLKGAPDEIYHRAVRFLTVLSSPASMIFADDLEIFERCQKGLAASGVAWLNLARGAGLDERDSGHSLKSQSASELPTRVQFAAWLRYMQEPI